jgi:hypothetical protein
VNARNAIVGEGPVTLQITCPNCVVSGQVGATIGARLMVTEDDSSVKATLRTKPVAHECGHGWTVDGGAVDPDQLAIVPEFGSE